jgi:hypothetical protein
VAYHLLFEIKLDWLGAMLQRNNELCPLQNASEKSHPTAIPLVTKPLVFMTFKILSRALWHFEKPESAQILKRSIPTAHLRQGCQIFLGA